MSSALSIPQGFKLVGVYNKQQCYGGHEEGGWWYDEYTHVKSAVIPESQPDDSLLEVEEPDTKATYVCPEGLEDEPMHRGESLEEGELVTRREEFPGDQDNTNEDHHYC